MRNLTTFFAANGPAIAIFTSIRSIFWMFIFHINVSIFCFTSDNMIEDSLIEIFPSINSKREKRKFYFLKGIHNHCKFSYKIMVRFSNSIFRVIRFAAIWISKFQNIHFPNVITESFFFGFHVKSQQFHTFLIWFLGQRVFWRCNMQLWFAWN